MIRIGRLRRRIGKMGMTMTAEAVEARKIYQREYRRRNRDKINSQRKNWRAENRDRVRRYNRQYWERRAQSSKDTRASYEDYGITPERLRELMEIAKSEKHAGTVLDAALKADRLAEEEDHKENKGLMNGHKWTAEWCQQIWETVSVDTFFVFGVMLWHSTTAVSESIRQSRQRG